MHSDLVGTIQKTNPPGSSSLTQGLFDRLPHQLRQKVNKQQCVFGTRPKTDK